MSRRVSHATVRDADWTVWQDDDGRYDHDQVRLGILLDIRAELKAIRAVLQCVNFQLIPWKLERIARNTTKPKRKKVTK